MGRGGVWGRGFGVQNSVSLKKAVRTGIGGNADRLHRTSNMLWADRVESVGWTVAGALVEDDRLTSVKRFRRTSLLLNLL